MRRQSIYQFAPPRSPSRAPCHRHRRYRKGIRQPLIRSKRRDNSTGFTGNPQQCIRSGFATRLLQSESDFFPVFQCCSRLTLLGNSPSGIDKAAMLIDHGCLWGRAPPAATKLRARRSAGRSIVRLLGVTLSIRSARICLQISGGSNLALGTPSSRARSETPPPHCANETESAPRRV